MLVAATRDRRRRRARVHNACGAWRTRFVPRGCGTCGFIAFSGTKNQQLTPPQRLERVQIPPTIALARRSWKRWRF